MTPFERTIGRPPRKPFEPTPWLVVLIIVLAIAFSSYINQSC